MWILEKEIQKVKAEKNLPYGEARRLVTAKSSPLQAPTSYATVLKATPKRSIEFQTPDFWMQDKVTLKELSKKPSIETKSTSSSTDHISSPINRKNEKKTENINMIKSQSKSEQYKHINVNTGNKFQSFSSDVDEDMEDTPSSPRPHRSASRSRRKDKNISPVKYKK